MQEDGSYRFFGISVLVNPDGEIAGRYNKIFLIPFGRVFQVQVGFLVGQLGYGR